MKRNAHERLARKRLEFSRRTQEIYPDIDLGLFKGKPTLAIRINPLKHSPLQEYGSPMAWAAYCYVSPKNRSELTSLPEFENGDIYLQNPSSFIPPIVLDPQPAEAILDMCAAPGGKASHIAALTDNRADLWINDNSKTRLLRMKNNLHRLGVRVHSETMFGIERIARELPHEQFDRILLDAPCSGEGALRLDDDASMEYWSVAQIKRLQKLQKQAVSAAWKFLKPGGTLVYSTCTIAPEENEAVIDWLLRKHEDADTVTIDIDIKARVGSVMSWQGKDYDHRVSRCMRVAPDEVMEAFFVAKVVKSEYTNT